MVRTLGVGLLAAVAMAGGCLPTDFLSFDAPSPGAAAVQNSPFTTAGPVVAQNNGGIKPPPAPAEVAIAVDKVGQQLVAANKSLGMKPLFLTIGTPSRRSSIRTPAPYSLPTAWSSNVKARLSWLPCSASSWAHGVGT